VNLDWKRNPRDKKQETNPHAQRLQEGGGRADPHAQSLQEGRAASPAGRRAGPRAAASKARAPALQGLVGRLALHQEGRAEARVQTPAGRGAGASSRCSGRVPGAGALAARVPGAGAGHRERASGDLTRSDQRA